MADKVQQEMGLLANWYTGYASFKEKTGTNACA